MEKTQAVSQKKPWSPPEEMTDREFKRFAEFIQGSLGIKMPRSKKTMLESRLNKRLRSLQLSSYKDYREYVFSEEGQESELPHLIDVVTTNKTEFFREASHFEFLANELLPHWTDRLQPGRLTAWSAGCSTGEEPYSMAMILAECLTEQAGWDFEVLGTDISREVLDKAARAVYREDTTQKVPWNLRSKYFLRSKDRKKKLLRIAPELRKKVHFRQLNFMDPFSFREKMDLIFCRNVIIYFEREVQEQLFHKLVRCLKQGGFLFIGHSETLSGMDLPLLQSKPTIYRKL